jgi:hypothetical protein
MLDLQWSLAECIYYKKGMALTGPLGRTVQMELILTDLTRHKLPAISLCRSKFLVFSLNSLLNAGASSVKKNKTSVINGSVTVLQLMMLRRNYMSETIQLAL